MSRTCPWSGEFSPWKNLDLKWNGGDIPSALNQDALLTRLTVSTIAPRGERPEGNAALRIREGGKAEPQVTRAVHLKMKNKKRMREAERPRQRKKETRKSKNDT